MTPVTHIPGPSVEDAIKGFEQLLQALRRDAAVNLEQRRARAVSKMAKNLEHGDVVDWPHGWGPAPITGWTMEPDRVLLGRADGKLWPLDPDERVRVLRG